MSRISSLTILLCILAAGCALRAPGPMVPWIPTEHDVEWRDRGHRRLSGALRDCRSDLSTQEWFWMMDQFSPVEDAWAAVQWTVNRRASLAQPLQRYDAALREFEWLFTTPPYGLCKLHLPEQTG